jgi:hypothetical protein
MNSGYLEVHFRAELPASGLPGAFGVITACNPCGKTVSEEENEQATEKLRIALESERRVYFPVTGGSEDFAHCEPGFGVAFESVREAVSWGQRFDQEAVFWIENGSLRLVPCDNSAHVDMGSWELRCKT